MNRLHLMLLAAMFFTHSGVAEQIELIDGSKIQGKVLSMSNGSYRIETQSLGVVDVPAGRIRSISQSRGTPAGTKSSPTNAAVQSLQAGMVQNQDIMSRIRNLQNDPDMQAVLRDPDLMQAIQSFDLKAVSDHPKIKRLMQNEDIKSIKGKVN
jgi:hypothetical protein